MPSIKDCLSKAEKLKAVSSTARLDTELLLQHALKKSRAHLYAWPEQSLAEIELKKFEASFERRLAGEPIAYILGYQSFWSLDLAVSPCTLIPRPETERLVEAALDYCGDHSLVLDLGTGTGAIALALASEFASAEIHAVDSSPMSIDLAIENSKRNAITNVNFYQSDWFTNVHANFDVIVSNPPYIAENDPHLSEGDLRFEPSSALSSGSDGMDDLRRICRDSPNFLFENGALLVEHGWNQGEAVRREFIKRGFVEVDTLRDLENRERVTVGRWLGASEFNSYLN